MVRKCRDTRGTEAIVLAQNLLNSLREGGLNPNHHKTKGGGVP